MTLPRTWPGTEKDKYLSYIHTNIKSIYIPHRELSVAKKSILGTILPEAMVNILHNYGADRLG